MVTIVVVINILISLILLCCTLLLCKLRHKIAQLNIFFTNCDRKCYGLLYRRPEIIDLARQDLINLRKENQNLQQKIRQFKQILALIVFIRNILSNRTRFN